MTRHETAARFLAALAGTTNHGQLIELRYRLDDRQRMGQVFESPSRLRGLATRAIALGRRSDVYVGCAPRTRRHGGRDAIDTAFVLWADCDGDAAAATLADFEPVPAMVIRSGTGANCHAYWPLTEPLGRDEVERANRRLAHALGADPASRTPPGSSASPGRSRTSTRPPRRSTQSGSCPSGVSVPSMSSARCRILPHRRTRRTLRRAPRRRSAAGDRAPRLRPTAARRRRPATSQGAVPIPRGPACKPARLRDGRAWLVLLRRLPERRDDLRPRRPALPLRHTRRGLPAPTRRAAPPVRTRGRVMTDRRAPHDLVYVCTDIPEGMTVDNWRARRATEHIALRTGTRKHHRRRRSRHTRRWLPVLPVRTPHLRSHERHG
jgi:hypothetical protein